MQLLQLLSHEADLPGAVKLVIFLTTSYTLFLTVYRIWFHPLAKYPGPLWAKLSSFYIVTKAIQCRDTYTRYELHQKYGSVVRTGPNELCFTDMNSIKDIYGQSAEPCLKSAFYRGFTLTGTHSVFSSTERTTHARMRRLLSNGLSERGVLRLQGELQVMIERYLSIIDDQSRSGTAVDGEESKKSVVELHDLTHHLFQDIVSLLSFGKSFDILATGKKSQGADDIETYFSICPLFGTFPLARYLPFGIFKAAYEAQPRIVRFVQACIDDYRARLLREKESGSDLQQGLLRLMLEAKDEETGTMFSDEELIENGVIFILAGSGTTASTLLYLIYELGKRPHMQQKLEKEIRDAFPDPSVFPDFETAAKLVSTARLFFYQAPIDAIMELNR
jgi:cytochrome P450